MATDNDSRKKPTITRVRTGCWTCRRRGYRCDEGKPSCSTCTRLNITCEGYGIRLKWDGNERQKSRKKSTTTAIANGNIIEVGGGDKTAALVRTARLPPRSDELSTAHIPSLDPSRSATDQFLLQHYFHTVSMLLASTGDPTINTYRRIILPMAMSCDYLLDAVLGLSAIHLSARNEAFEVQATHYKGRVLKNLITRMQNWHDFDERTLATVIMLEIHEIFEANPTNWTKHLEGAGSILNDFVRRYKNADHSTRALLDVFAYHDVLASISTQRAPMIPDYYTQGWSAFTGSRTAFLAAVDTMLSLVARLSMLVSCARAEGHTWLLGTPHAAEAVALGARLQAWRPPDGVPDDTRHTAEAMRHAGLLFFWKVYGLPEFDGSEGSYASSDANPGFEHVDFGPPSADFHTASSSFHRSSSASSASSISSSSSSFSSRPNPRTNFSPSTSTSTTTSLTTTTHTPTLPLPHPPTVSTAAILSAIAHVAPSSAAAASHVWPLYMAGLFVGPGSPPFPPSAADQSSSSFSTSPSSSFSDSPDPPSFGTTDAHAPRRAFIRTRLHEMKRIRGIKSVDRVRDALERIWDGTGADVFSEAGAPAPVPPTVEEVDDDDDDTPLSSDRSRGRETVDARRPRTAPRAGRNGVGGPVERVSPPQPQQRPALVLF